MSGGGTSKSFACRGNSQYKGPEAGPCLATGGLEEVLS